METGHPQWNLLQTHMNVRNTINRLCNGMIITVPRSCSREAEQGCPCQALRRVRPFPSFVTSVSAIR